MGYHTLLIERESDGTTILSLNRPDRLNAVTAQMLEELGQAVRELNGDPAVRAVIVTGAGRAFCAGRDLGELGMAGESEAAAALPHAGGHESSMFRGLEMPTIAAVNGAAVGAGLGFVLQCDVRLASERAFFIDGHLQNNMAPSIATWYLPRIVGVGRALQVFCTRERIKADEARRLGFVDEVVPGEELMAAARRTAALFVQWDPELVRHTKRLALRALEQGYDQTMEMVGLLRGLEHRRARG